MAKVALSAKQALFVVLLAEGKTQSEAYIEAGYSASSTKVATSNAHRLLKTEGVRAALQRTRAASTVAAAVTLDSLLSELEAARVEATKLGQMAAVVAATVAKGKLTGLLVERRKVDVTQHKPAFSSKVLELSEDEWRQQFAPVPALPAR